MPGLIWVRDPVVGDVMVDRSFRVGRFRPEAGALEGGEHVRLQPMQLTVRLRSIQPPVRRPGLD